MMVCYVYDKLLPEFQFSHATDAACSISMYNVSQDPNGKGLGNRGPPVVWMQYEDPAPGPGLVSHDRETAQDNRPSNDLIQPRP